MAIDIKSTSKKLLSLGFGASFFRTPLKMVVPVMNQAINEFKGSCVSAQSCIDFLHAKHIRSDALKSAKEKLNELVRDKFKTLTLQEVYTFYNNKILDANKNIGLVINNLKNLSCANRSVVNDLDSEIENVAGCADIASFAESYGKKSDNEVASRTDNLNFAVADLVSSCDKRATEVLMENLKQSEDVVQQTVDKAANNIVDLKEFLDSKTEAEVLLEAQVKFPEIYNLIDISSKNRIAIEETTIKELKDIFETEVKDISSEFADITLRNGRKFADIKDQRIVLEDAFGGNHIKSHQKGAAADLIKIFKRSDESSLDKFFQCRKDSDFEGCVSELYKKDYKYISKKCHPDHIKDNQDFCTKLTPNFPGSDLSNLFTHIASEKDKFDSAVSEHWVAAEVHDQYNGIYQCLGHHAHQLSGDEFWVWAKEFGCL